MLNYLNKALLVKRTGVPAGHLVKMTPVADTLQSNMSELTGICSIADSWELESISISYRPNILLSWQYIQAVCLCPSICLSVNLSFPPCSIYSSGWIFPYLLQMINTMSGCVACDDPWPWPISSRSFGLDLENRVASVASTVLGGFFLYLAQMITIIRGCVACYVFLFRISKFEFLANCRNFSALTLKKNLQFSVDAFHI